MGNTSKKIYDVLPYPLKFIVLNIKGYLNSRQRYTKKYKEYLQEHLELWSADRDVLHNYQKEKLQSLLSEAFLHTEWYKNIINNRNIDLSNLKNNPFDVLSKMPVLTKYDRKNNTELLVNTSRKTVTVGYSSGTSGSPTKNYLDRESINRSFALWKRFHKIIGLNPKEKHVRFSGRIVINPDRKDPPYWVYNIFEKQLLMSSYHLSEKNLPHYVKKLNQFKPRLLDGYPSAIFVLSRYINQNNIILDFIPKAIAVTAETLYDYQRAEIESAFKCKVFNQYASSEGSPFITECIKGNLHLNLDSGIFEFKTSGGHDAKPGEIAQLVVTSFTNLKTPIIRYNIEDTILLPKNDELCTCGSKMPIIEKITGREDDILWTEEKGYVGRMGPAFKGLEGIEKSQIIQESPTEIKINIIVNYKFDKNMETQFLINLKERLGKKINIKINIVEDIPLGSNGKYNTVKRNFKIEDFLDVALKNSSV